MKISNVFKRCRQRFLFVGQNCSFHGLNHLFKRDVSLLSRLFWLLTIIAMIIGLYLMLVPVLELGVRINYTPDTRYLNWTTTFPGFTVCEEHNTKAALRKFNSLYPELLAPLNYDHRRYLTDLLFARSQCSNTQCEPCGKVIPCDVPWRDIIERMHKSCEEMLAECSFFDIKFPCCQYFRRVDSEHGPCFSFNTLQHIKSETLFVVNRTTGPASLAFRLLSHAEISIHSSEELSTNNLDAKLKHVVRTYSENQVDWLFSIVEINNDQLLLREHINERGCRFLNEIPDKQLHTYPVYSHGACRLAQSTTETFAYCGCVHPARDLSYKSIYCNYNGINCWNNFEEHKIKMDSDNVPGIDNCLPSCVESELTTVHFSNRKDHYRRWRREKANKSGIAVNIKMVSLPTLRYQRKLIRTHLDLVVSVGGIAGLFFSASILSFLEIKYLILRPQKFDNFNHR